MMICTGVATGLAGKTKVSNTHAKNTCILFICFWTIILGSVEILKHFSACSQPLYCQTVDTGRKYRKVQLLTT
jgi:hypothetical protein